MITLSDNTVAMFFLNLDDESDLTGAVERIDDNGTYKMTYRFRYYNVENDPDPYSGWDTKNWYSATSQPGQTDEKALALLRKMLSAVEEACGNNADIIQARSAGEYMEILKTKHWAHMKVYTAEEAAELGLDKLAP